jgi:ABC-type branched-subunit amino acid transport system substrate-binding protein
MPHLRRFGYRFFAVLLLMTASACFMSPEQAQEAADNNAPPPGLHDISPEAMAASNEGGKVVKRVAPREVTPDYAPATHIKGEEGYGPATSMNESTKATTVKVALLIPMSGPSADLGQSLLDAAVLAVYDKYNVMSPREITAKIEILPKDTGDSIETAEKAAQDAIQEGATLILGPVFSKQVSAVASEARHKNIPVISFSNNVSVAGNGVYLFGFLPEQQVIRIIQYTLSRKITNIAALVPSNPYGAAIVKQLSAEVRKTGGRAHPIEYYQEDMSSLQNNVGRLARFLEDENGKSSQQALFIAEGRAKLKTLTDMLAANGVNSTNVQLLGTGLWDDTDILKWPELRGGWFASSPPEKYHTFEQHFVATYGYRPERLASLSYDAVALAATVALSTKGAGFPQSALTDPVGFSGPANGIFRFRDDGSIERGLSVLMVTPMGFKTIDPAPSLFNQ